MSDDLPFRGALLVLLLGGLLASTVLRRRADRAGGRVPRSADSPGVRAALGVAGAVYYGSLLAWLVHPPLVGWAGLGLPPGFRWLGGGVAAAGIVFALLALRHLGRNVTPTAAARMDAELVTSGPYRHLRHPLYSSMILTVPGLALLSANLLVLVGGLATIGVLLVRTRREEEELEERLGRRYAEYRKRTGRFLPRFR